MVDVDVETEFESALSDFEDDCQAQYHFTQCLQSEELLHGLNEQRSHQILCDVILCVGDQEFPCHRNVLAASSPYFMAMFTHDMKESRETKVNISGIEPQIMMQLINFLYTSKIMISPDNAQLLMSAASLLQIQIICNACCEFLERQMVPSNCLGIHCFAEAHVCIALSEKAKYFVKRNFREVAKHDEIMLLPHHKLIEFISSDDIDVDCEVHILELVLKWVKHDVNTRQPHLADILTFVRLPLIDPYIFFDIVESEPMLLTERCKHLIDATKRFWILKDRQSEVQCISNQLRLSMQMRDTIVLIGGEIYNKNYLNCTENIDLLTGGIVKLKELPFPRCHHGAVVSENKNIYIAGGFNKEKTILNGVLRYEFTLDKWIRIACMNSPRTRFALASLDGYIYAVGGYNGHSKVNSVERYCVSTNTWTYVQSMPVMLSRCQAVGMHGCLYVAGGVTDTGKNMCLDLVQKYDPKSNTWQMLAAMPTPACLSALLTIDKKIYAVGGTTDMLTTRENLACYDPVTNQWTELSPMINKRFDSGATTMNGNIYIISGHDGENSFYTSIEEYNPAVNQWRVLPDVQLSFGRCRFGCVGLRIKKIQ